ncbi:MAG TPA: FAD-binding protein [Crocinitomix sp.]|nr:FAD-binding protein [Crocinitomix sp.]
MVKMLDLRIPYQKINDNDFIYRIVLKELKVNSVKAINWVKKSLDARSKNIVYNLRVEVYIDKDFQPQTEFYNPQNVSTSKEVIIIGAGPAGLFAALNCIEKGLKPIIFERGKNVRARRRDLADIHKKMRVNQESNYCFGEGGAGTFSDGKLYTRSKKRGSVNKVLQWLVHFGADTNILIEAHPHIGTNKLPKIIQNIRASIIENGGEVHFNSKLTDFIVENKVLKSIEINQNQIIKTDRLILATGHSARDIYELLHQRKIKIEAKPFALGVRIEHQQKIIDQIQYHGKLNDENLPPASYSLVTQVNDTGVFSFCMCPGGIIAPCATQQNEVVTNGWSPSKRNNKFANSGIVVQIIPEKLPNYSPNNPFVCLEFQKEIEHKCWVAAGKTQRVPAQRLMDFINDKTSTNLPKSSYQPGIVSVNLNKVLPKFVTEKLRQGFLDFGKKMKGFLTNEAVIHAPESRTSSPIRIPRHKSSFEHIEIKGLYPLAEGAGYAGGIVSAAVDGIRIIDSFVKETNF